MKEKIVEDKNKLRLANKGLFKYSKALFEKLIVNPFKVKEEPE